MNLDAATYYRQDHSRCSINIYEISKWIEGQLSFLIWKSEKWLFTLTGIHAWNTLVNGLQVRGLLMHAQLLALLCDEKLEGE